MPLNLRPHPLPLLLLSLLLFLHHLMFIFFQCGRLAGRHHRGGQRGFRGPFGKLLTLPVWALFVD